MTGRRGPPTKAPDAPHVLQHVRPSLPSDDLRRKPWRRNRLRHRRLSAADPLEAKEIQAFLDKRKPGQSRFTTQRREADEVRILSGVFLDEASGKQVTTGTPIALLIENTDQRSKDYSDIKDKLPARPRGFHLRREVRPARLPRRRARLGARDRDAGGRGRRRAKGAAGGDGPCRAGADRPAQNRPRALGLGGGRPTTRSSAPIPEVAFFEEYLDGIRKAGSSVGAIVEVVAEGVPAGFGAPVYGKLDAELAGALMSDQCGEGRGDRRRLRGRRAHRRGQCRRDSHRQRRQAAVLVQSCRRHFGRHLDRPADRRAICGEAHLLHPHPPADGRPLRARDRYRHQRPPRSLRRHPRRAGRPRRWLHACWRTIFCGTAGRLGRAPTGRLSTRAVAFTSPRTPEALTTSPLPRSTPCRRANPTEPDRPVSRSRSRSCR